MKTLSITSPFRPSLVALLSLLSVSIQATPPAFIEDFSATTINASLVSPAGFVYGANASPSGTAQNTSTFRRYVTTAAANYNTVDFVAEVTFTVNGGLGPGAAFFGFGSALQDASFFNEPHTSIYLRAFPHDFDSGKPSFTVTSVPGLRTDSDQTVALGNGTHRGRIQKTGNVVTLSIDGNSTSGSFVADYTFTRDLSADLPFLNSTNSRLFFGTEADTTSFDNFSITVALPSNPNLLAYEGFDYALGTLAGKSGGIGFSSAWAISGSSGTTAHAVVAGSISASGVSTAGNKMSVPLVPSTQSNTGYCSRNLTTPIGTTGTTRYFSAVMRGDGTIGNSLAKFGGFFGVQFDGTGANDLIAGLGGAGTVPKPWQVEQIGGVGTPALSNVPVVSGVPVLMVMKLEFLAGADRVSLYINPATASEPTVADAIKTDKDTGTLSTLALNNGGAFSIDEIRLGTTFADVVPGLVSELMATWNGSLGSWTDSSGWTSSPTGYFPNGGLGSSLP